MKVTYLMTLRQSLETNMPPELAVVNLQCLPATPHLDDSHGCPLAPTSRDVGPGTSAPHTGVAVQWWESHCGL